LDIDELVQVILLILWTIQKWNIPWRCL